MKRELEKQKTGCGTSGVASKTAFWMGAVDRLFRSTLCIAVSAFLGFMIGVGATIMTQHVQYTYSGRSGEIDELIKLVNERKTLDDRIEKCFKASISDITGKEGILVWDGKKFSIEKNPKKP